MNIYESNGRHFLKDCKFLIYKNENIFSDKNI